MAIRTKYGDAREHPSELPLDHGTLVLSACPSVRPVTATGAASLMCTERRQNKGCATEVQNVALSQEQVPSATRLECEHRLVAGVNVTNCDDCPLLLDDLANHEDSGSQKAKG